MIKLSFFLMTKKGLDVIKAFVEKNGVSSVLYVVGSKDSNVTKDYFDEIRDFCSAKGVSWIERNSYDTKNFSENYKVAVGWRWIIEDSSNLIVLHDSLLPKYRGFSPLTNMLVNGEKLIGVTAIMASESYDSGDILLQKRRKIKYPIKLNEAIDLISELYVKIVLEIYEAILKGKLTFAKQNHSRASYSIWLDDYDYFVDWAWSSEKIRRFVDAVGFPFEGAKTKYNGDILILNKVDIVDDVFVEDRNRHLGKIIFLQNGFPVVICGQGLLKLVDLHDKNNLPVSLNFRTRLG